MGGGGGLIALRVLQTNRAKYIIWLSGLGTYIFSTIIKACCVQCPHLSPPPHPSFSAMNLKVIHNSGLERVPHLLYSPGPMVLHCESDVLLHY